MASEANPQAILSVDKFGVQDKVLDLYKDGNSLRAIRDVLQKEGISISVSALKTWIDKHKLAYKEKVGNSLEHMEKFEAMTINYETEITTILDEVKEMKNIAKEQGKLDTYAKLVDRLYRGLELLGKVMGDINPNKTVDINLIFNEINKATFVDNKDQRQKLFKKDSDIFDVEAEIVSDDKVQEERLKK